MTLLSYTFPVAFERSYLPVAALLVFLLIGSWLLNRRDPELRLGGLNLIVVSVALAAFGIWTFFFEDAGRRFHAISVAADHALLSFSDPDQTLTLPRSEIDRISFDIITYARSSEVRCNLQLKTTSGKKYVSQYRMDMECKNYRHAISQVLGL